MSYLALARKWRPRTFSQLVGQEHINKALINALNQQRLHHAYLFTGTRGVGKTSIARILARALNCEQGVSSEPCMNCEACIAIEQGRFIDLIEIDGASKTKVEDTRDLLDNVQYAPSTGRFKIYLIDEVHMLSQHSFNALLKTLEEPPNHVKFILATTDPQKLPVTVLSRCLQFNLRHLSPEIISQQLQIILKDEQIEFEDSAISILAQAARGSMRDALSLLDKAITSCDNGLTTPIIKSILGYTQQDYALHILQALAEQNAQMLLTISSQIAEEGGHFHYVLNELLTYFHQISIHQSIGDTNPLITPSPEIKALAQQFMAEDIQLFYQFGLKGSEEIHLAPTLLIGFNMTVLRMLQFRPTPSFVTPPLAFQKNEAPVVADSHQESPKEPEPQLPLTTDLEQTNRTLVEQNYTEELTSPSVTRPNPTDKLTELQSTSSHSDDWTAIIAKLKLTGLALNAIDNAEFIKKEGREITLAVAKGHLSLFTPTVLTRIESALTDYYQNTVKIVLNSNETVKTSPAQQKEKAAQETQHRAEVALENDPSFKRIQQEFSAELIKNSIVPLKNDL